MYLAKNVGGPVCRDQPARQTATLGFWQIEGNLIYGISLDLMQVGSSRNKLQRNIMKTVTVLGGFVLLAVVLLGALGGWSLGRDLGHRNNLGASDAAAKRSGWPSGGDRGQYWK